MSNPCSANPLENNEEFPADLDLDENEDFVHAFHQSIFSAGDRRDGFLRLLREVVPKPKERWRVRRLETGIIARFDDFRTFLESKPPAGLHVELALIEKLVAEDLEAKNLIDQALKREPGRPSQEETVNNINGFPERPMGTSSAQAIRKLRESGSRYLADVLAGKMTPNAAMIKEGYRKRHYSIDLEDAFIAAKAIRKHASPEYVAALITFLTET